MGTPGKNKEEQSSIESVLDYATSNLVDFLPRGSKSNIQFPFQGECSEPWKSLPRVTTVLKNSPESDGRGREGLHPLPSVRKELTLCYRKGVHIPAASATSGDSLAKQNVRPDFS